MKYTMKVDMKPLGDALRKSGKNTSDNLGKAVLAGLFQLEAGAKLRIRENFKQRTGDLASNWETKLDSISSTKAEGHTAPLVVYARIQELGGVINAVHGALIFQTDDGEWHTVKAVTIPARPYLRPAADEDKDDIFKAVSEILQQAIEGK